MRRVRLQGSLTLPNIETKVGRLRTWWATRYCKNYSCDTLVTELAGLLAAPRH